MEYKDFANIFSSDQTMKFSDRTKINGYDIKLVEGKLFIYGPMYSLCLVE